MLFILYESSRVIGEAHKSLAYIYCFMIVAPHAVRGSPVHPIIGKISKLWSQFRGAPPAKPVMLF